jgi:S-layer homology domain
MKSLATTFLVFITCLAVAGTIVLVDRTQAMLSPASDGNMQADTSNVADPGNSVTLAEFANVVREKLSLPQPSEPVVFDDLQSGDANYAAAEALYPFLRRQLLCPECTLTSSFSPRSQLTRAQAAVVLVSILSAQERIRLLSPEQASDVLADVPDADAVSVYARPYIATALADGILVPQPGNMMRPTQPYSRTEIAAVLSMMQRRFPPSTATASLHITREVAR